MDIPWFLDYPLHKLRLQISMFFSAITPSEPRLPQVGGRSSWISPRADGSYAYTYKILQEQPNIKHLCRSLIVNYCKLTKMMHELQLSWVKPCESILTLVHPKCEVPLSCRCCRDGSEKTLFLPWSAGNKFACFLAIGMGIVTWKVRFFFSAWIVFWLMDSTCFEDTYVSIYIYVYE